MGFRDRALGKIEDQRAREQREKDAKAQARYRHALDNERDAWKVLRKWASTVGIPLTDVRMEVEESQFGPDRPYYSLRFTWTADGCDFRARYVPKHVTWQGAKSTTHPRKVPAAVAVEMKDPEQRGYHEGVNGWGWCTANTIDQIGEILSGQAWADACRLANIHRGT